MAFGLVSGALMIAVAGSFRLSQLGVSPPTRPVAPTLSCARIRTDAWSPLPGVEYTGVLSVDLPPAEGGTMSLIIADALPLDLEAQTAAGVPLPLPHERVRRGPGVGLPPDLWLETNNPFSVPHNVVKATLRASAEAAHAITLRLGRRAPRVLARLDGYADDVRAEVCARVLGVDRHVDHGVELDIAADQAGYFGTGWFAEEADPGGETIVRWMGEYGAVLVPSAGDGGLLLRVRAAPPAAAGGDAAPLLSLRVNDVFDASTTPMRPGRSDYEWSIPAAAWVAGTNELLFSVSRTVRVPRATGGDRVLGLALERLTLSLQP